MSDALSIAALGLVVLVFGAMGFSMLMDVATEENRDEVGAGLSDLEKALLVTFVALAD